MFSYVNSLNLLIYLESAVMAQALAYSLEKRNRYRLRLLLATILFSALSYFFPLAEIPSFWGTWAYAILMYMVLLLLTMLSVVACVKANWIKCLFCAVGGYAAHHLAGTVSDIIISFFHGDGTGSLFAPMEIILHLLSVALVYAVMLYIFYGNRNTQIPMDRRQVVILAALVVLLNIVISSLDMLSGAYGNESIHSTINDLYNCVTGFLAIFILFGILERGHLEREVEIINNLYRENMRQYEVSKATMESLHDLRHRINALMVAKAGLTEEEQQEISDKIFLFDSQVKTGNETLDIILAEKKMLCHQYGIEFDCMVDGARLAFMDVYDLYSLFGNALSNAIEAVCRQKEGEPRLIFLSVRGGEGYVAVHLENTFDGQISLVNGVPVTGKEDRNAHGFGMKSMERIVKQYGGTMTITVKDELFHLDILFDRVGAKAP